MLSCDVLYTAFDLFPGTKGTQAHIARNIESLTSFAGHVTLACLGYEDMPSVQFEENLTIRRFKSMHPNFLIRARMFADFLDSLPDRMQRLPGHVHFRDIWSGLPLLENPSFKESKKIFECNGLPSLELPTHYPSLRLNRSIMQRLRHMEDACLAGSEVIITVSATTARYLVSRGAPSDKIRIIPNAARTYSTDANDPIGKTELDELIKNKTEYIFYTGVLTEWQGIDTLVRAFALACGSAKIKLVIAASNNKFQKRIMRTIDSSGIKDSVIIKHGLPHTAVMRLFANALFSVAPLARGARNEVQGACPVKIVESMACGSAVLASDLEICRELIEHGRNGWLVTPDSHRALAAGILRLMNDRALLNRLNENAATKAKADFSREGFTKNLVSAYNHAHQNGGAYGIGHTA